MFSISIESLLQSFKFREKNRQVEICALKGYDAWLQGGKINWRKSQVLFWDGVEYKRESLEYQELLDIAYASLFQNLKFQQALKATGTEALTHKIGKQSVDITILTENEFCSRLMEMRSILL